MPRNRNRRERAERMVSRGASAARIERKTGVSSRAATRFVNRAAAAAPSSRTSAVQTNAGPDPMGSPAAPINKGTAKQGLRIAGVGGISGKDYGTLTDTTKMGGEQLVRKLDKINAKLESKGKTGISLNRGAVRKIIKGANKQRSMPRFTGLNFGTGAIGQDIMSRLGDPGSAGRYVQGQLVGAREAVEPRYLGAGLQINPKGREKVRGKGPQYEYTPKNEVVDDGGGDDNNTLGNGNDTLGGGQGEDTIQPIEPVDTSQITEANPFDLASWATGFRRARSARQRAGRRAQGTGSMKKFKFKQQF